jgi:hypothetical protein
MRLDLAALRQFYSTRISSSAGSAAAAGGAALALLTVVYVIWPGSEEIPADAVIVSGPVFTPVAMTPPAPAPAVRPSAPKENALSETRFNDPLNVTRAVQRQLTRAGCYEGPVNGVWNAPTRRGMAEFTNRVNARLPVDRADPVLLVLLESNQEVSCTGTRGDQRRAEQADEVAGVADEREAGTRDRQRTSVTEAAVTTEEPTAEPQSQPPRAEDLGYSAEERRAPNPLASVQTASTEMGTETGSIGASEAAALAAAGAAVAPRERASPPERRRTARRYKKKQPNLAKSVSKGLKSLQRSLNKLF